MPAPASENRLIDGDAAIVTARLDTAGMALQEQTVGLHPAVGPLVIGR